MDLSSRRQARPAPWLPSATIWIVLAVVPLVSPVAGVGLTTGLHGDAGAQALPLSAALPMPGILGGTPEQVASQLAAGGLAGVPMADVFARSWNAARAVADAGWARGGPDATLHAAVQATGGAAAPCAPWAQQCREPLASWQALPQGSAEPAGMTLKQAVAALGPGSAAVRGERGGDYPESLERLAEVPEPVASALASILVAMGRAQAAACPASIEPEPCAAAPVDLLAAARDQLAVSVLRAAPFLGPLDLDPIEVPGLFSFHFRDEPTLHSQDVILSVDFGGDDTYSNNAGGAGGAGNAAGPGTPWTVALALDLSGNDSYTGNSDRGGVNGGAAGAGAIGLLVDWAGDDTYVGHVGGRGAANGGGTDYAAGGLLDLQGNDTYDGQSGDTGAFNGGGYLGSGMLFDAAGRDHYGATTVHHGAANGGGAAGTGVLVDLGGDDTYEAVLGRSGAINGGAWDGQGFLFDAGGSDHYGATAYGGGLNGASALGWAILVDLRGNDTYAGTATDSAGVNGGTVGGHAILLDLGGNDVYSGSVDNGGINGATLTGHALLLDAGGDDRYNGTVQNTGGINGAGKFGEGTLVDLSGNDTYGGRIVRYGGVNGASQAGTGVLLDLAGNDTYWGEVGIAGGINGATTEGVGVLVDGGGTNEFISMPGPQGASSGAAAGILVEPILLIGSGIDEIDGLDEPVDLLLAAGAFAAGRLGLVPVIGPTVGNPTDVWTTVSLLGSGVGYTGGLGVLIAGPGDDHHRGRGVTQGAGDVYGMGILVDTGGNNTYRADAARAAQGAGSHFGTGFLADLGRDAQFWLDGDGQGAGVQGLGVLWRPNLGGQTAPETTLTGAPGSRPGLTIGAGMGLRILDGPTRLLGVEPSLDCPGNELAGSPLLVPGGSIKLCQVHESSRVPILNPSTGEPVGNVSKPAVDCSGPGPLVSLCSLALNILLGPNGTEWMAAGEVSATTSGGLSIRFARTPSGMGNLHAIYEVHSADNMGCRFGCDRSEEDPITAIPDGLLAVPPS